MKWFIQSWVIFMDSSPHVTFWKQSLERIVVGCAGTDIGHHIDNTDQKINCSNILDTKWPDSLQHYNYSIITKLIQIHILLKIILRSL